VTRDQLTDLRRDILRSLENKADPRPMNNDVYNPAVHSERLDNINVLRRSLVLVEELLDAR
jgi:hypothetical protein